MVSRFGALPLTRECVEAFSAQLEMKPFACREGLNIAVFQLS
jgi:hypothetical protein